MTLLLTPSQPATVPMRPHRINIAVIWFIGGACLLFELPILLVDKADMEQYDYEYFSAFWQLKDVWRLQGINFWQDVLGFGSPLPIGFNLTFHPIIFLNTILPDRVVIWLFQLMHVLIATLYLNALLARFSIRALVRVVVVFLYLLGPPTLHYHFLEDWPGALLPASLLPVFVFYVERFFTAATDRLRVRAAISIGLVTAAAIVWGAPGLVAQQMAVVGPYAVLRGGLPPRPRNVALGAVAVFVAVSIYSAELFRIASHMLEFDLSLPKLAGGAYHLVDWFAWAVRPLDAFARLGLESSGLASDLFDSRRDGAFTCVFFIAMLAAVSRLRGGLWRVRFDPPRAASVMFLAGVALTTVPPEWTGNMVSAGWLYRDSAVLFALIVYAFVANDLGTAANDAPIRRRAMSRVAAVVVGVMTVVALGQAGHRGVVTIAAHVSRLDVPYRGTVGSAEFFRVMNALCPGEGGVVYQSYRVEEALLRRGGLQRGGAYASSDFARAGYANLVRRYFKTYSTDIFHPDYAIAYGHLPSRPSVIQTNTSLDFFGVTCVIVSELEIESGEFRDLDQHLAYVGDYLVPDTDGERLRFYRNDTPYPLALAFDADTLPPTDEVYRDRGDRLLGAQWQHLTDTVLVDEPVQVVGSNGRYTLTLAPHPEERVVLFRQWYRPEWEAWTATGEPLLLFALYEGFIGITVPVGVDHVFLEYRPVVVQLLWLCAWLVAGLSMLGVWLLGREGAGGSREN